MADFWDEMYLDEYLVDLEIDEADNFSSLAVLADRSPLSLVFLSL